MHPLNIVILLPLCSSHISYKMTHLRNCCLSAPCTPQPLPGAHGQHVCVVCVNVCSLRVSVSVCVSLLDHFLWLWRWTGRGEECFFFPSGYLGVVDKEEVSYCLCWLLLKLSGKRGSLNLDAEKQGCIVSPQRQITRLDRSVEFGVTAGGQDPSDQHKTTFYLSWEQTAMAAEPVCVSVSLTPSCFWLGAPNMLLFSNKWGAGMAHSRHGVYSCQDNSQAAAGLESDLHASAQSAAVMVDGKSLWLHLRDSYGLHCVFIPRTCAWSRNMWCTVCGKSTQIDSHRTEICSCRKTHGGIAYWRFNLFQLHFWVNFEDSAALRKK